MKSLTAGYATALLLMTVACTGAAPSPSPSPGDSSKPAPTPSPSPVPSAPTGLYMRVWQEQALPPPATFLSAPVVTVSDGMWIDNMVAVPAIFPGPLMVLPNARTITPVGEKQITDQARELGLLDGQTDFTGGQVMPGGITGMVAFIIDGVSHTLNGDPSRARFCDNNQLCPVDPGTPEAFAAFYTVIQDTRWLEANLGPNGRYQPESVAVLLIPPASGEPGIPPNKTDWPLETDFAEFGQPLAGGEGQRCANVTGEDLDKLLPALLAGNQLTVFVDATGAEHSVQARALVPGEKSPCGAG
jgi:hypothetical protein